MSKEGEILCVATVSIAEGKESRFRELFTHYQAYVCEMEPGCLQFEMLREENGNRFALIERYASREEVEKHAASDEYTKLFRAFAEERILAAEPIVLLGKSDLGFGLRRTQDA